MLLRYEITCMNLKNVILNKRKHKQRVYILWLSYKTGKAILWWKKLEHCLLVWGAWEGKSHKGKFKNDGNIKSMSYEPVYFKFKGDGNGLEILIRAWVMNLFIWQNKLIK